LRETELHVVGIGRPGIVAQVARYAGGVGDVVVVVLVAIGALARGHGVLPSQRKSGGGVIELGIQPVIEAVAAVTACREIASDVVRIAGCLIVGRVTAVAVRRHRVVLAERGTLVAGIAIDGRVGSQQRHAIVVIFDLLDLHLPAFDRMALFTIRAELPFVNVGVAIGTTGPRVGKYRLDMAFGACHRSVHPAQRKLCAAVIEFRDRSNRLPAYRGMAVLAGDIQRPVRTATAGGGSRLGGSQSTQGKQQDECTLESHRQNPISFN